MWKSRARIEPVLRIVTMRLAMPTGFRLLVGATFFGSCSNPCETLDPQPEGVQRGHRTLYSIQSPQSTPLLHRHTRIVFDQISCLTKLPFDREWRSMDFVQAIGNKNED